jgi:prepilin-type N-terminal cleavage/methylation domain-containing protein
MSSTTVHRGVTLIELLVVIVLLGLFGIVAVISSPPIDRHHAIDAEARVERLTARLASARSEALRTGQIVVVSLVDSVGVLSATALPDGSVLADPGVKSLIPWNELTGAPRRQTLREGTANGR